MFAPWSYTTMYMVAAVVTALLVARAVARRGWPADLRNAIIAGVLIAGSAGARWLPLDSHIPVHGEKTILGALLGGAVALALVGRWYRVGAAIFDVGIPAVPVGMAIGRVGCFLAGCCAGLPTAMPWGVRYPAGSHAFSELVATGTLGANAATTPFLHPVQLYEAFADLLLAYVLSRHGSRLRSRGGRALAFAVAYAAVRFALECLRFRPSPVAGLAPVQWGLLASVIALGGLLAHRELSVRAHAGVTRRPRRAATPSGAALVRFSALIVGGGAISLSWATPLERMVVLAAVALVTLDHLRRAAPHARMEGPLGVGAMLMLLQPPAVVTDTTYPRKYLIVGGSAASTSLTTSYDDCDGNSWTVAHSGKVALGSVALRTEKSPDRATTYTASAFAGTDNAAVERVVGTLPAGAPDAAALEMTGLSFALQGDHKWIGYTLGATTGRLYMQDQTQPLGVDSLSGFPIVGLRVGRLSSLFVEGQVGDAGMPVAPLGALRVNMGVGLGKRGSAVRFGLSDAGPFAGVLVVGPTWEIEPQIASAEGTHLARIAVRYRFRR